MYGGSPHTPRTLATDTEGLHQIQDRLRLYSKVVLGDRMRKQTKEGKDWKIYDFLY